MLWALSEGGKINGFLSAFVVKMVKLLRFLWHLPLALSLTKRTYHWRSVSLSAYAIGA